MCEMRWWRDYLVGSMHQEHLLFLQSTTKTPKYLKMSTMEAMVAVGRLDVMEAEGEQTLAITSLK